jgi:hypothetical protein
MTTIYCLDYIINATVEFPSKNGAGNINTSIFGEITIFG